ncbi:TonB-dependent receptor [Flavihumibacter profundi]|jgi:iron complex outermembrane recepter protein|uniref:TonB-dependent receptor n=1 Tax=Flavihumibacter profundi TaxID=2716883 RepID=UPI001CC41059|nr:TonB-dependent receptor [Flavihumibacter profundi]MBZ5858787.1 TonB-dependent receptor [Flavihumibacter profundi]
MLGKRILLIAIVVFISAVSYSQQLFSLQGTVSDKNAHPLPNVSIHLLNTLKAVVSDMNGKFNFPGLAPGNYEIELTCIGYAAQSQAIVVGQQESAQLVFVLQDQATQLDDIVVTANKSEQQLQKTPLSITALSSRQVEQYRLWNSKELTAIVPNLYSGNSGDDRNVTSIRGITTTSYDPAVAVYVDGVNQFSLDTYIPQLADIERIEVLRGPQGTLYGRNAMGGVINIITKQPANTTTGFAEVSMGDYGLQRYAAGVRTPLVKGKLFFGASGVYQQRDGYYTNEFNHQPFDNQKALTGNYYLKYLISDKWTITANVKHQNNRNFGAYPMVFGVEEAFANPYKLNQNAIGEMVDNTLNSSLTLLHEGKGFQFSSQTAWQTNRRIYKSPIDGDFSPIDGVTIINDYGNDWNKVKVFTQEFRFNSTPQKSERFNWVAGTYFFSQHNPSKQATHFGEDAGMMGVPDVNFSTINSSTAKNKGVAFFGQLGYALTKKVQLIGGLRYDYESRYMNVKGEYQKDGQDAITTQPDTATTVNFSALSPKLGVAYQVSGNSNLFANYSRGFRTGGLTQLSADPSQPPLYPYKPEYSNNIEVGWKNSVLNNRLRINVTAFYTTVTDAQVPTLVLPEAITVTRNTGKLNSMGVELEISARPFKGFEVDYNLGYTNAKYSSLKLSQNGEEVDLDGKKQIFTPDMTSMLALQYSYPVSVKNQVTLVARGEWMYLGQQYFDLANTIRQSPYQVLNARIGVNARAFGLFFWGRNLTGKKYIAYAYDFGAVHLGDPSTVGLTGTFRF